MKIRIHKTSLVPLFVLALCTNGLAQSPRRSNPTEPPNPRLPARPSLDLTQQAPDLVVTSAEQRGSRRRDGQYLVVPLVVTVKNGGTASADTPFKIGVSYASGNGRAPKGRLSFRHASALFKGGRVVRFRGLNASRSQRVIGEVRIHDPRKTVSEARVIYLKAKVDAGTQSPIGAVAESNEGNNWSRVARRTWNP